MKRILVVAALASTAAGAGCWPLLGLSDKEYTLGPTGSTGAGGTSPGLVRIEHGDDSFSIDATEVTNADYAAWLQQDPAPTPADVHDSRCAWNTSFLPGAIDLPCDAPTDPTCGNFDAEATASPSHPVHCVDWCDAEAYCTLHGKRLCGGAQGAPIVFQTEPGDFLSPVSEWYFACSGGTGKKYPYGPTLDAAACNDGFGGNSQIVDVGVSTCEGGFPGIFDMSGNVDEWVDACSDSSGEANCVRGGGAYYSDGTMNNPLPACDEETTFGRHCQNNSTGFRCCAD